MATGSASFSADRERRSENSSHSELLIWGCRDSEQPLKESQLWTSVRLVLRERGAQGYLVPYQHLNWWAVILFLVGRSKFYVQSQETQRVFWILHELRDCEWEADG